MKQRIKSQKGQTLTEVLIALAALGTALVAMLYGVSNAVVAVNTTANTRTAMNIARSQIEYIQAQSFNPDIQDLQKTLPDGTSNEDYDPNYSAYLKLPARSRPVDINPNDIVVEAFNKSPHLQLIRVTVNYVGRDAVLEDYKPSHPGLPYAIFATSASGDDDVVTIQGTGWRVQGDVLSRSGVTMAWDSDNNNKVNGDLTAEDDFEGLDSDVWGTVLEGDDSDTSGTPSPIIYTSAVQLGKPTFLFNDASDINGSDRTVNLNLVEEDVNGKDIWEDWPTNTRLKEGLYYYKPERNLNIEKIILSASNDPTRVITTTGKVTFIAEAIEIRAPANPDAANNNLVLSPYFAGILAFATPEALPADGVKRISVSVNNSILSGDLYAPGGSITIGAIGAGNEVTNDVFAGMAVAQEVKIYGKDCSIGF